MMAPKWCSARATRAPPRMSNMRLGPVGVVELQRHAGDHQQQEAGDHQDVQEPLERREAGEPLVVRLGLDLGLAEGLRVVQVQVHRAEQPEQRCAAPKKANMPTSRPVMRMKDQCSSGIVLAVERVGVGHVLGEARRWRLGWHCWQVATMFVVDSCDAGSDGGRTSWWPWQS